MVFYRSSKPEWIDVAEAAWELGVSSSSVRRWAKQGLIHAIQPHTMIRINRQSLEDFKEGRDYAYMTSLRGTTGQAQTLYELD